MVKIFPLYSGSGGNCTLVQSDNANLLVDVGLGCRATLSALKMYNLSLSDITAIVVTHEHSDLVAGLILPHRICNVCIWILAHTSASHVSTTTIRHTHRLIHARKS